MYLLFVDESGTHGSSHSFVLGGVAIHEDDAQILQTALDKIVSQHLDRIPPNLDEYELHASEMRNAKKPASPTAKKTSMWASVDRATRHKILAAAYDLIASFKPSDPRLPLTIFGRRGGLPLPPGVHA
ncbi:DUF3800 domain-containing protein [Aeromicrobium fastidiosum]|uniref:DUF3800 domain-containing protein n=1 Tax=Aeromicrobium fastidiosum TaxID=52699 RepID=A0A641ASH9_9ACTN|nr:DUF3800 domain-containing protein [Aeromicrobium fastidiosum]KAA1380487.1 DUF3800 domain-containing protein [Aeromicrobium fastidiosum]MBP2390075.1 hypothetical protein [Aeromicrobium fastidiosum]